LYDEVRRIVREVHGHDVFLIYGSLLGAVREEGVIGHDVDLDSAFISPHTNGPAAARELQQIAFTLIEHGLDVECMRTALHIHAASDPAVRIDLFHLYFDAAGLLQFPFGIAGTSEVHAAEWEGTTEIDFAGARAAIPVNAEQLVEHIYGSGWHEPKPGFDWDTDRTARDLTGIHPIEWCQEVYWTNFYSRMEYPSPSPFFETVNARPDLPNTVLDIGCGDGRDACGFGLAGRRVTGLDRSQVGVEHATKKAAAMSLADRVGFQTCDVGDADQLRDIVSEVLATSPAAPVLFYLRFFLHSIPEDVQDTLMGVIAATARPGDLFATEFRTDADEAKSKVHTKHYRRFQNGPAFGVQLAVQHGFTVIEEQEGTGLAPYQDEDPEIYRVIARR
jgi:SAM-dependent methyltransferase